MRGLRVRQDLLDDDTLFKSGEYEGNFLNEHETLKIDMTEPLLPILDTSFLHNYRRITFT